MKLKDIPGITFNSLWHVQWNAIEIKSWYRSIFYLKLTFMRWDKRNSSCALLRHEKYIAINCKSFSAHTYRRMCKWDNGNLFCSLIMEVKLMKLNDDISSLLRVILYTIFARRAIYSISLGVLVHSSCTVSIMYLNSLSLVFLVYQ